MAKRAARITGINPEKAFLSARQYERATIYLHRAAIEKGEGDFILPGGALSAFSVELYLKAFSSLLTADKSHLKTHNLLLLFEDLPESEQLEVERHYKHVIALPQLVELRSRVAEDRASRGIKTNFSIRGVLAEGANAFEYIRYIHDDMGDFLFFGHQVGEATRRRVIELRSEWEKHIID